MFTSIVLSYLPYTLVTAFTPGPNNIVSLYAVSNNGWRKGKNILLGIVAGFLLVMAICALFCYELEKQIPAAAEALKYVGAAYIAWLAAHVALSAPGDDGGRQMSFWKGFWLEFVNVKIIFYALTVYTGYVQPRGATSLSVLMVHAVILTLIGAAGCLSWATAGGLFQRFLKKHYRPFNIAMGLVLLYCAATLAFDI